MHVADGDYLRDLRAAARGLLQNSPRRESRVMCCSGKVRAHGFTIMDIVSLKPHKAGLLIWILVFLSVASVYGNPASVPETVDGLDLILDPAGAGVPSTTPSPPEAVTKSKEQDNFYFDPAPMNTDVVEGEEVRLRCDVSNRKMISFYWTLNGRRLSNDSRRYQDDSDLRILRVDRDRDLGSYRCIATNVTTGISVTSTEAKLNMHYMMETAEVQLKQPRELSEIAEGVDISLKCHAEGNPEPEVIFYKNKIRVVPQGERIKFIRNNRIRIAEITAADNGVYSCSATNSAGHVDSADNFLLNVQSPSAAHLNTDTFTRVVLVEAGSPAHFDCEYSNSILTEWYFGDQRLGGNGDPDRIVHPNGSLVIRRVREEDAGSYSCTGLSQNGPAQSFMAELLLAYLDPLTADSFDPEPSPGQPMVVPLNGRIEVHCKPPKGLPLPVTRWEGPFGAVLGAEADARITAADDGVLTISAAQDSDSGNYTCRASNKAGSKALGVSIMVSVPPTITRSPVSNRVEEGKTGTFSCLVKGTPYPVTTITWRKEEDPLDMGHPRFDVDPITGTLTIRDVHLSDEANYACVVNTTGHPVEVSTYGRLYVEKKLKFRPTPVNSKLELGIEQRIYCKADGKDEPTVHWLKADAADFPSHVEDQSGILLFKTVEYTDAGKYTCIATSKQGSINATIQLDVVIKPRFTVKPRNTTALEGYPVMIHCVAIGDPQPTIHWDKNNQVNGFDVKRFKVLSNGSLYVTEVFMEDTGKYGCTAGNSGGFQRDEVFLHVGGPGGFATDDDNEDDNFDMMKTIIIAVCSAVAYLAIVIGLTVYCSIRLLRAKNLRKRKENMELANEEVALNGGCDKHENGTLSPTERTELMDKKDSSIIKGELDVRSQVSGMSSQPSNSSSHPSNHSSRNGYDKMNFPRHDLQTLGMLGKGHYGDVFLAKAHGIKDGEPETLVVVKSLLTRDEAHHFEFRREMDLFSKLNHENIVKLLGVCREMEPQFLITEYCEWGDLKQFLWATRPDNGKRNVKLPPLTIAQKVTMCQQVAVGMEHVSNHRFVHKDLATRNVLLSPTLDLKITSLCLCRDVYANEYFPFHQQLLPLRWMPPEAVLDDDYSTKSDVWAYGVFVWEVFSQADLPYRQRTDEDVLRGLKTFENRLEGMRSCPENLANLVAQCMAVNPKERPSFSEIAVIVGEMTIDSNV